MKPIFRNIGYFLGEAKKMIQMNWLSHIFSFLGTGLILFILGMVFSGGWIGNQLVEMLQEEAEISAYFDEGTEAKDVLALVKAIENTPGVWQARLVDEAEAFGRMEEVLAEEAHILELFEGNPFEAFIEVRINLDEMDLVLEKVSNLEGIHYVRDNRAVLERIQGITGGLKLLGYLVMAAVGITTLVIVSHMVRQGIYHNRHQINTLRLLGAPGSFIGFPFVIVGLLLTLGGGILAAALMVFVIHQGYGQLSGSIPFIPLPSKDELVSHGVILVLVISAGLGILGSFFGLSSSKHLGNHG